MTNLPAGAAHYVYVAKCGCEYSGGNWGTCAEHTKPHSEHDPDNRAPWCDECVLLLLEDIENDDEGDCV